MKTQTLMLLGGGAVGLYLLTKNGTSLIPGAATTASNTAVPTTYGINGGYSGNHAAIVANYAAIVAANPNQANPNYQLTAAERNQYVANYQDIAQGIPTWPGGLSAANIQKHWTLYGVADQRIFLPLEPPSTAPYIPPVQNKKSSGGSSFISTALGIATTIIPLLAGSDPQLNDGEIQLVMTGGAIMKDILPFYKSINREMVNAIDNKLNDLLLQYS